MPIISGREDRLLDTIGIFRDRIDGGDEKSHTAQFQPPAALSLDEQLTVAIRKRNASAVRLECDEKACLTVDKDKHPEIYDWLVHG